MNLTFGMVGNKLVWFDFQRKLVQHVDFDLLEKEEMTLKATYVYGKINWYLASSLGFTVREVLSNFTQEEYRVQGVHINEIEESSVLRKKKIKEDVDGDLCLMQLTAGSNITVYNLQKENRYEVSLIPDSNTYSNPISFSNTGFARSTPEHTLQSN